MKENTMTGLYERAAAAELIASGKRLLLAGDEAILAAMPKGDWIGGTIPYFMAAEGGLQTADRVFVTELPAGATVTIRHYDTLSLPSLAADHPGHGFTVLLIPAFTAVHTEYAKNMMQYPGIFDRPVVGWISGVALADIGKVAPKVFDGRTGQDTAEYAMAMHIELPAEDEATVNIINLFERGDGPAISFDRSGFSTKEALFDGKPGNLATYLIEHEIDTKLPLVADYNGAMVNVSIKSVHANTGQVEFYAPVFPNVEYRIARPVSDYVKSFADNLHSGVMTPAFSCNCILNYLYAGLEGRSTAPLLGPVTFGEIAYMLLNQTAVYLTVTKTKPGEQS